jgi:hypothetical protein
MRSHEDVYVFKSRLYLTHVFISCICQQLYQNQFLIFKCRLYLPRVANFRHLPAVSSEPYLFSQMSSLSAISCCFQSLAAGFIRISYFYLNVVFICHVLLLSGTFQPFHQTWFLLFKCLLFTCQASSELIRKSSLSATCC